MDESTQPMPKPEGMGKPEMLRLTISGLTGMLIGAMGATALFGYLAYANLYRPLQENHEALISQHETLISQHKSAVEDCDKAVDALGGTTEQATAQLSLFAKGCADAYDEIRIARNELSATLDPDWDAIQRIDQGLNLLRIQIDAYGPAIEDGMPQEVGE